MHMTHPDLSAPWQSLWHFDFFFSRQFWCGVSLSQSATIAAIAPTYKPWRIPGKKENSWMASYNTHKVIS